jgi:hypothetical protein
MTINTNRFTLRGSLMLSCFAASVLLVFTSAAFADPAGPPAELPALGFRINDHGQGPPIDLNPPGLEIARDRFSFVGEEGMPGVGRWHIQWDISVNPDPFIFADIIVSNNLPVDQEFTFNLVLPINPSISGGTLIGGSFSGVLKDRNANGAALSVLDGANPPALYSARIDGNEVQTLFENPGPIEVTLPFQTSTFGPEHFGTPIPSLAGPNDVNSTISIEINLKLSAMDSANLSGSFIVEPVPEPSTMALCMIAVIGLACIRRRRRAR